MDHKDWRFGFRYGKKTGDHVDTLYIDLCFFELDIDLDNSATRTITSNLLNTGNRLAIDQQQGKHLHSNSTSTTSMTKYNMKINFGCIVVGFLERFPWCTDVSASANGEDMD